MGCISKIRVEEHDFDNTWTVSVRDTLDMIVRGGNCITPQQMIWSFDSYHEAIINSFRLAKKYNVSREIFEPKSRTIKWHRVSENLFNNRLVNGCEYLIWPIVNCCRTATYYENRGWYSSVFPLETPPVYFAECPSGPCI